MAQAPKQEVPYEPSSLSSQSQQFEKLNWKHVSHHSAKHCEMLHDMQIALNKFNFENNFCQVTPATADVVG